MSKKLRFFADNGIVAIAYFLTALTALWLANASGIASPIWPPSGVALAAVLLFRSNILFGILAGGIGSNFYNTFVTYGSISETSLWVAFGIGFGAVAQAYLSGKLVRRFSHFPNPLEDFSAIAALILLGGPVGCLVNATLSNTLLFSVGFVDSSQLLMSWVTWWSGDSMGVAVFTPTLLVIFNQKSKVNPTRKIVVSAVLTLVFALSTVSFIVTRHSEVERTAILFEKQASKIVNTFTEQTKGHDEIFIAIDRFISSRSGKIKSKDFNFFTDRFLERKSEILALSWNRKVSGPQRAKFEQELIQQGFSNFKIKQRYSNGNVKTAQTESVYFPVTYINPLKGNEKALGHNTYADDPVSGNSRKVTLDRARDSGLRQATSKISIVQADGKKDAILVYHPVYFTNTIPELQTKKRVKLAGYVAAVFYISNMLKSTLVEIKNSGKDLIVTDMSDVDKPSVLFSTLEEDHPNTGIVSLEKGRQSFTKTVDFSGRKWKFNLIESQGVFLSKTDWTSWGVMVGGLMFSILLILLLLVLTGQTEYTKRVIEQKTKELDRTRIEVIESAKLASLGTMAAGIAHEINNPLAIIGVAARNLKDSSRAKSVDSEKTLAISVQISKTVQRIAKIIDGLKKYGRDESKVSTSLIEVRTVIDDSISLCTEKFKSRGIELLVSDNSNEYGFWGKAVEITQVIVNLMNNSFQEVEKIDEKWIQLDVTHDNGFLNFSVTDSGKGIPQETVEKMFDPFFTTKDVGQGTGLGLSISAGIIQSHNGKIWVDESHKNTRIIFRIPAQPLAVDNAA